LGRNKQTESCPLIGGGFEWVDGKSRTRVDARMTSSSGHPSATSLCNGDEYFKNHPFVGL